MSGFVRATDDRIESDMPRKSLLAAWAVLIAVLIVAMSGLTLTSSLVAAKAAVCTGACAPPQAAPQLAPHVYTSSTLGFALEYADSAGLALEKIHEDDHSIGWQVRDNPFYTWEIGGQDAKAQDAQQIVEAMKSADFPNASLVYTMPQAEIGYTPGFGKVYDDWVAPPAGDSEHVRLFMMASVKDGVAVTMEGMGLYKEMDYGHPNPSMSLAPLMFDAILNTVTWKGEPPL